MALVAAGQAVDFKGWAGAALLGGGKAAFAKEFFYAQQSFQVMVLDGEACKLPPLKGRERRNVVVKARNGHTSVRITHPGEQVGEGQGRIFHGPAEDAGVQIARRAAQGDFEGNDAAQGVGERRMSWTGHAGVRDDDSVACQFPTMGLEKFGEVGAADFFLAFDDKGEVAGQGSAGF